MSPLIRFAEKRLGKNKRLTGRCKIRKQFEEENKNEETYVQGRRSAGYCYHFSSQSCGIRPAAAVHHSRGSRSQDQREEALDAGRQHGDADRQQCREQEDQVEVEQESSRDRIFGRRGDSSRRRERKDHGKGREKEAGLQSDRY